jgi:ubiquinone/menaquinone biosynthesis C-methylase UbiE
LEHIKTSIKRYWNWRSTSYITDNSIGTANTWESILRELVEGASGGRALDIGTGRGQFAVYLARSGFNVTGIDLSEKMVFHARQNAMARKLNIDFQTGDAEKLEFDDSTFDVVVSRNLLWTLPDPGKAFMEWRRVMKPGGTLVVSDGFWMNYTWKRVHHLALKLLKGMFRKSSMVSACFFYNYASLQKSLPFYEGICFEHASMLLQAARFKEIRSYDTSWNPYEGKNRIKDMMPSFFIAYAKR